MEDADVHNEKLSLALHILLFFSVFFFFFFIFYF